MNVVLVAPSLMAAAKRALSSYRPKDEVCVGGERGVAEEIFDDDPLLLNSKSQHNYGRILLRNLLIGRTLVSGIPDVVDLHDYDGTKLEERMIYAPPEPPQGMLDTYIKHRYERKAMEGVPKEHVDALELVTMAAKGERTERRLRDHTDEKNRVRKRFATLQKAEEELSKSKSKLAQRLRIAAIGHRVKISKLVGKAYLGEDLCGLPELPKNQQEIEGLPDKGGFRQLGRTTLVPDRTKDSWQATICHHIGKAVENGSHLVVVPEFGLPPSGGDCTDLEKQLRQCSEPTERDRQDHFVFAGSRHEGGSNRGMLFHLKDQKLQGHTHWHYKVASARSLGENILGPFSDEFPSYTASVDLDGKKVAVNVTIAICYDSFDPSTFLSLVLHSVNRSELYRHRIILVPSFNPSRQFVEFLRDLSFLTMCAVVYVNSLHGDAKMFIAGIAVSDIADETGAKLVDDLNTKVEEVQKLHEAELETIGKKMALGQTKSADKARRKASLLEKREEALIGLYDALHGLEQDGGLNHLITVESCKQCEDESHTHDGDCYSDILYYNIDLRLLTALARFRKLYFRLDETFLPEPFRRGPLAKAKKDLEGRVAKRRALAKYMKKPG